MDFTGKNVIVTGGASGIGRAIVQGVVDGNGTAVIVDFNLEAANKTRAEISESNICVYRADMSNSEEVTKVFAQIIADLGHVDALINSAGIVSTNPLVEITDEEWNRVLAVDLSGVFYCIRAVYSHMVERGYGRIVNVSSVAGKRGGGLLGTSAYATAKAGVIGLTKAVARESALKGITCNAVCPGTTMSPMISAQPPEKLELAKKSIPMGRFGEPKEIANMVLFLASDLASFVTGEISDADGGIMMDS